MKWIKHVIYADYYVTKIKSAKPDHENLNNIERLSCQVSPNKL